MSGKLTVSFSPHIQEPMSIQCMSYTTMAALTPAVLIGFYYFGIRAIIIVILSVLSAMATEAGMQRLMNKPVTVKDGTAALTGLLLAMILPVGVPWWAVIIGAAVALFLAKHLYGGLGGNPFNTVIVGYVVLMLSWPDAVNTFYAPLYILEPGSGMMAVDTSELPLGILAFGDSGGIANFYPLWTSIWGGVPGGIGSTSVIALTLGGLYLVYKRIIQWQIPLGFLGGLFFFALICWLLDGNGAKYANPFYHLIYGYTIIGAFFLATDWTTSPYTGIGALLYGAGIGILTMIIRYWGAYQEGVFFAILFLNALTPVLDRLRFKSYGQVKTA